MRTRPSPRPGPARSPLAILAASLAATLAPALARGQCTTPGWLPGDGVAGTNLYVACSTLWDPDGAGPAGMHVVIGGRFDVAGNANVANIAMWDLATGQWSAPGTGVAGVTEITALAVLSDGRLVAGGSFTEIGGVPANAVAAYDGTAWAPLGDGLQGGLGGGDATATAMVIMPNGDLVVGGDFLVAGSIVANGVARWNGTAWSGFGTGAGGDLGFPAVTSLAVLPNGHLVAAGNFTTMGSNPRSNIARWNGSAWQNMAGGMDFGVNALAVAPNGNLYASGYFLTAGGNPAGRIARWNSTTTSAGNAWSALGAGLVTYNDEFYGNALHVAANGDVYAAGNSYIRDNPTPHANGIARWDGASWSTLAGGLRDASDNGVFGQTILRLPGGDLLVGGQFNRAGGATGVGAANLARWNGSAWSAVASGFNDWLTIARPLANGDVIACGAFSTAGPGPVHSGVARWNGSTWGAIGSPGVTGFASDAIELADGRILVAGGFYLPGQDPVNDPQNGLAIFDGTSWTTTGVSMPNAYGYSLARLTNGNIVVGGLFTEVGGVLANNIAVWDGTDWAEVGGGIGGALGDAVLQVAAAPGGQIVAGGFFTQAGSALANNIAVYQDEAGWTALGAGTDATVYSVAVSPGGDILAAGAFASPAPGVARWDGSSWSGLGAGIDNAGVGFASAFAPSGDLYLGGQFDAVSGVPASNIARWDGSAWSALGDGVDGGFSTYSVVYGLAFRANGELMAAGQFNRAGGQTCVNFARYCPGGTPACDPDVNQDGNVDQGDVDYLIDVVAGGPNPTGVDPDFNHDGNTDQGDVDALLNVVAGGACP